MANVRPAMFGATRLKPPSTAAIVFGPATQPVSGQLYTVPNVPLESSSAQYTAESSASIPETYFPFALMEVGAEQSETGQPCTPSTSFDQYKCAPCNAT